MKFFRQSFLIRCFALFFSIASLLPSVALASPPSSATDASSVVDERPSAAAMALDAVVARPLMGIATILGAGGFIVTLPFSAIGGNVEEVGQKLVVTPFNATIMRCLGCTRKHVGGSAKDAGY